MIVFSTKAQQVKLPDGNEIKWLPKERQWNQISLQWSQRFFLQFGPQNKVSADRINLWFSCFKWLEVMLHAPNKNYTICHDIPLFGLPFPYFGFSSNSWKTTRTFHPLLSIRVASNDSPSHILLHFAIMPFIRIRWKNGNHIIFFHAWLKLHNKWLTSL